MPTITFAANGRSYDVPEGASFMEFCQTNDAPHRFGCAQGSCGVCVCALDEGAENVDPPSDEEVETVETCSPFEGARLGCQLKVNGDITVRAFG
jgi:ferredoxin